MPSSPHALTLRERGTPVHSRSLGRSLGRSPGRSLTAPWAAGLAIALSLLSPACDDEHKDAFFGTDAGAGYDLPPADARSDGTADRVAGDGADAVDGADSSDAHDGGVDAAPETGTDAPPIRDTADTAMVDVTLDLAPDLAPAVDVNTDTANDASPG